MIVFDTRAWSLWEKRAGAVGISAMSGLELADLIERGRIRVEMPTRAWRLRAFDPKLTVW